MTEPKKNNSCFVEMFKKGLQYDIFFIPQTVLPQTHSGDPQACGRGREPECIIMSLISAPFQAYVLKKYNRALGGSPN